MPSGLRNLRNLNSCWYITMITLSTYVNTRAIQNVRSPTQKETMNAENSLPALSSTYCINTAYVVFGLLLHFHGKQTTSTWKM